MSTSPNPTATRIYTDVIDRTGWPAGPWDDEPQDKVQWTDETTGMACLALRNRLGAWCGYVGVEPGHSAYGKDYDDVAVDVHGGLTYSDRCFDGPEERSICHIPEPGTTDDVWWLGFDCAHAYDLAPEMRALMLRAGIARAPYWDEDVYRTLAYVQGECAQLAVQLAAVSA